LYEQRLPAAKRIMVEGMHSLPSTLRQCFVTCKGPEGKVSALRELLGDPDDDGHPPIGRAVVFCNSQASARFVDHTLVEHGYATSNYHGAVPANERDENFQAFRSGESSVLVTTDLAARGLDNLDVSHVVQFDFPKSAADYIHRCGRTARAGRRGTSSSLVTKHDTELVQAIRRASDAGDDLLAATQRLAADKGAMRLRRQRPGAQVAFPTSQGVGRRGAGKASRGEKDAAPRRPGSRVKMPTGKIARGKRVAR